MMDSWPHYNSPRLMTISIALSHPLPVFSLEGFEFHRTLIPVQMDLAPPSNPFQFNLEDIVHPRSADLAPAQKVAEYLHGKLCRSFDKEVRNRLRAECPRPELPDKVAETPEIDARMLTFFKKIEKDPKKGIDRAWPSLQDKLPDLTGPLANCFCLHS
ncbi:hypothetical protein NDU88_004842 [Pleurodeles waltl]|uniref:Uncharacterized protein n=1 Tax=Pleurodeles waltl TaxID=8319 RepID=A0AAV7KYX5_PLEWA|nr:hypothetical protein NDU88_004842 [Pleurodeles waltl]